MNPLSALPDETILTWWAEAPIGSDYAQVAHLATAQGHRTSAPQARRYIKRIPWLAHRLPHPPRSSDYLNAKAVWRLKQSSHDLR